MIYARSLLMLLPIFLLWGCPGKTENAATEEAKPVVTEAVPAPEPIVPTAANPAPTPVPAPATK